MDEQIQVIKLCGACGNQGDYDEYHSFFQPCKKCTAKIAQFYQKHRDMLIAGSKLNQQTNRENRKYQRKTYKHQVQNFHKRFYDLTKVMETLKVFVEFNNDSYIL